MIDWLNASVYAVRVWVATEPLEDAIASVINASVLPLHLLWNQSSHKQTHHARFSRFRCIHATQIGQPSCFKRSLINFQPCTNIGPILNFEKSNLPKTLSKRSRKKVFPPEGASTVKKASIVKHKIKNIGIRERERERESKKQIWHINSLILSSESKHQPSQDNHCTRRLHNALLDRRVTSTPIE